MIIKLTKILLVCMVLLESTLLNAQENGNSDYEYIDRKNRKNWNFKLSPYAWLAGTSTDVGGEKIRQSFNDLASLTNLGFQVVALARYKRWSLYSNLTYAELGIDEEIGPINVDAKINQVILDTKLGYTLIDKIDFGDNIIRGWAMTTTIGALYWTNDVNVDLEIMDTDRNSNIVNEKQKWTDLVVGVDFRIILSKTVLLGLSTNFGGFGIGNSTKLYWDILYVNTFRVSNLLTVTAGYKTFNYNRIDGTGDEELKTSVKTFGPLLGVSFNL